VRGPSGPQARTVRPQGRTVRTSFWCSTHRKEKHNKEHKRVKCGERKKNKDIYKDRNQTSRHRKPEENGRPESAKDTIRADELINRVIGQGDHTDHKYNNTELLPWSTDSIGSTGAKEKERNLLGRMVKKSA
jgi:hypothetical protein